MQQCKIALIALLIIQYVHVSNHASLSASEQKKYKQFLEGQGLYGMGEDVEVLTNHNFNREVPGSSQAWLVEFYNSWCGFCQRFAPSWKALATDIKGWNDLVRIGAMDCSDDDNSPICRDYEIMAYPTLRYFHERFEAGPKKLGAVVQKGEDVNTHRHQLISRLIREQTEGRATHFPVLTPYLHNDLSHLFDAVPNNVQYIFLVIDKQESFIGAEVALDLHKTQAISVRYATENNTLLVNTLNVKVYPSVFVTDRKNYQMINESVTTREQLRDAVKKFLHTKNIIVTDDTPRNKTIFTGKWLEAEVPDMAALIQERARQALKERVRRMGDVVFQMDLETVLRYSFNHEISTVKTISGEKLQVLRNFLALLVKYFPFGREGQNFLTELSVFANDTTEVSGEKFAEIVKKAELDTSQVFSTPAQWLGCRGSTTSHRGYPCGLWTLFHYLTVNSAIQHRHNPDANPKEVLDVMHGYVKNYFGCADCSQHFQEMALKRELNNVSSVDSAVLWLWMAHNEVNKRLSGDQTEDPEYPKIQFPSPDRCPDCRHADGSWNLVFVLDHLKHMYGSINVRYIGADTRILHLGIDHSQESASGSNSIFRSFDLSMCFVLYVVSFFLVALLIRMFLKRGYKRKPYMQSLLAKV